MTANGFQINDRIGYRALLVKDAPARECRVAEVSKSGALRIQEIGGPRIPWWVSPRTAVEWAHAEALDLHS